LRVGVGSAFTPKLADATFTPFDAHETDPPKPSGALAETLLKAPLKSAFLNWPFGIRMNPVETEADATAFHPAWMPQVAKSLTSPVL
jgi:hypothetical protein